MDDSEAEVLGLPPEKLAFPDFSKMKSLRKYFNRAGYQVYPAWIYHPSEAAKIVKTEAEAAEYGVSFRRTTPDERAAFGVNHRWDYTGEWRTKPFHDGKKRSIDPDKMESGKNYVPRVSTVDQQNSLIEALIPQVAAAVAAALKIAAPAAPEKVDADKWARFQEFLAFEESTKAVTGAVVGEEDHEADEKAMWLEEADRLGVKVDKRWGLERLKEEIQKAA